VWPKRTVGFYVTGKREVWDSFQALLNELGIGNTVCTYRVKPENLAEGEEFGPEGSLPVFGGDKTYDAASTEITELIFGPELSGNEPELVQAQAAGLKVRPLAEFVHRLFAGEVLLPQPSPGCEVDGLPLLWRILQVSGYEPSVLWPDGRGGWLCQRGRGMHWVVPETWWANLVGDDKTAEDDNSAEDIWPGVKIPTDSAIWVVRGRSVDFYWRDGRYLGSIRRFPDPTAEQFAGQAMAVALGLGVPWRDVAEAAEQVLATAKLSGPGPEPGVAWWEESLRI